MKIPATIMHSLATLILVFAAFVSFGQQTNVTDAQGRKQGDWKQLHPNGQVRYSGQFKDDKAIGLFQYYFDNGKLSATNNHSPDGAVSSHHYHTNGKIKAKGIYRNMKKDSLWQYFNEAEVLVLEETYKQNLLHGVQRSYYDNGQIGEELHYRDSVKHGSWLKFFPNSKKWTEAFYKNGNLDGLFKLFGDDGKPKVQGSYIDGVRNGVWLMFNLNGSVRTQDVYANGILKKKKLENGEFEETYESGIPKSKYTYVKGKRQGDFEEWYDLGKFVSETKPGTMGGPDEVVEQLTGTQLRVKGYYNEDVLNGKVTHYKQDGSIDKVEIWENGELKSSIDWEGKP
jgi:antitoxin component YwqK of YwqJK toxin-antitoxin module